MQALARYCGIKIHLPVDQQGVPLSLVVRGANPHDKKSAERLIINVVLPRPTLIQHLCADKAYDATDLPHFLIQERYHVHIKPNPRRAQPRLEVVTDAATTYPARCWVVERTLAWLIKHCSIRTRWPKLALNWLALIQFACAHILFDMAYAIYG